MQKSLFNDVFFISYLKVSAFKLSSKSLWLYSSLHVPNFMCSSLHYILYVAAINKALSSVVLSSFLWNFSNVNFETHKKIKNECLKSLQDHLWKVRSHICQTTRCRELAVEVIFIRRHHNAFIVFLKSNKNISF